jgi:hypothetical protein
MLTFVRTRVVIAEFGAAISVMKTLHMETRCAGRAGV